MNQLLLLPIKHKDEIKTYALLLSNDELEHFAKIGLSLAIAANERGTLISGCGVINSMGKKIFYKEV